MGPCQKTVVHMYVYRVYKLVNLYLGVQSLRASLVFGNHLPLYTIVLNIHANVNINVFLGFASSSIQEH